MLALSATLLLAPAARAQTPPLPPGQVAQVAGHPILKTDYDRWYAIELAKRGQSKAKLTPAKARDVRDAVLGMLITAHDTELEAARRGIVITPEHVDEELSWLKRIYRTEKAFRRYLRRTRQTVEDVRWYLRFDILTAVVLEDVVRHIRSVRKQAERMDDFVHESMERRRAQTVCGEGYFSRKNCGSVAPLSA